MSTNPSDIAKPSVNGDNDRIVAGVPIEVALEKLKKLDKERTPGPWGADSNGRRDEDLYDFLSNPDGKIIADTCNADEREIVQEEDGPVDVRGGANMRFIEQLENLWTAGALIPKYEMKIAMETGVDLLHKVTVERNEMAAALEPFGVEFMDPPDGGDVSVAEQLRRMAAALVATRQKLGELVDAFDADKIKMESADIRGYLEPSEPHPWHEEWLAGARALLLGKPKARRWRHLKRNSTYVEVGRGRLQVSAGRVLPDHFELVVYRAADGSLWCRPPDEFTPDRFEEITAADATKG